MKFPDEELIMIREDSPPGNDQLPLRKCPAYVRTSEHTHAVIRVDEDMEGAEPLYENVSSI